MGHLFSHGTHNFPNDRLSSRWKTTVLVRPHAVLSSYLSLRSRLWSLASSMMCNGSLYVSSRESVKCEILVL
jgi:hypothetical protein